MLDEEHQPLYQQENDTNIYTLGRVGEHNVVVACLPAGQMGTNSAVAVAVQIRAIFPSIRFGIIVGIGGGVPSSDTDIRLGDVVVSQPHNGHGGVVQYDFGKDTPNEFKQTGFLNAPPTILLNAVEKIKANRILRKSNLSEALSRLSSLPIFVRPTAESNILFKVNKFRVVERQPRKSQEIMVHYGTIASSNKVMRSDTSRGEISSEFGGVLCLEMETAGLQNSFPYFIIWGIYNYANSHKNKDWQAYAAGTAAAYTTEVLSVIPAKNIGKIKTADEIIKGRNGQ